MGKEAITTVRIGVNAAECRVLLEAKELLVRGELKLRIPLEGAQARVVEDGVLEVSHEGATVAIALGPKATAWLEAIRNPRSRMEKLGIAAGTKVCVLGEAEQDALDEIAQTLGAAPSRRLRAAADVVLCFAREHADLARLARIEPLLTEGGAVWVLWPKGRHDFTHDHVVAAGRAAGLTQTRSLGFSEAFTGLRLVRPSKKKAARGAR